MELRSKVVPTTVSSKSTKKKVFEVVEIEVFEEEVKSECRVEKKEEKQRVYHIHLRQRRTEKKLKM